MSRRVGLIIVSIVLVFCAVLGLVYLWIAQSVGAPGLIIEDCTWSGTATAWIDRNQNGRLDAGEQRLPGVVFHYYDGASAITDWKGEAQLGPFMAGCGDGSDVSISVEIPAGYALTTPATVSGSTSQPGKTFAFGFITKPGVPTPTARPAGPICTRYHLGRANRYDLTDIVISPNGTIWVSTFNAGVFMLAPNSSDWLHFTESQGLVGNQVRSITVDGDSSIWFATSAGASHFDGHVWTSYTAGAGLLPADVSGIAVDGDLVWFATYAGASMLDTTTGTWRSFTKTDGLPDDFLNAVGVSKDGSVWFAGMDYLWRLRWPDRPAGTPSWSHYGGWVDNIERGPNDTLWFVGFNGVQSYDPQTDSLRDHTDELSKIGLKSAVHSITFAPDDSMWLGSETSNEIFHVLRDPNTQLMTVRSYDSRDGLPKEATSDDHVEALAFAPDGSFWLVTQEDAAHCSFPK